MIFNKTLTCSVCFSYNMKFARRSNIIIFGGNRRQEFVIVRDPDGLKSYQQKTAKPSRLVRIPLR